MSTIQTQSLVNLKLDLGCGNCKKEGTIGIDIIPAEGVDYVLDIQNEPLPFPDKSVDYVYSSHFLEHIDNHVKVFQEISRVAKDKAILEFWTPYAWTNDAFIFGHNFYFTEELYLHLCLKYPEIWLKVLGKRWILKEIRYMVSYDTLAELYRNGINLSFAMKHYINIVAEIGFIIEICEEYDKKDTIPQKTFSFGRNLKSYPLKEISDRKKLSQKILIIIGMIKEMGIKNFVDFFYNRS
jgi:SAM-dependent methyltransferase